jgi:predicted NBD/HSP70 family sugar kinase
MCAKKTGSLEDLAVVGIDLGKDTFHLVGFDRAGQTVMRKQIKRLALNATCEQLPRCIVGMEACLSAHFVSRTLRGMGRGGSVDLYRFRAFSKWFSASVTPPPLRASAG